MFWFALELFHRILSTFNDWLSSNRKLQKTLNIPNMMVNWSAPEFPGSSFDLELFHRILGTFKWLTLSCERKAREEFQHLKIWWCYRSAPDFHGSSFDLNIFHRIPSTFRVINTFLQEEAIEESNHLKHDGDTCNHNGGSGTSAKHLTAFRDMSEKRKELPLQSVAIFNLAIRRQTYQSAVADFLRALIFLHLLPQGSGHHKQAAKQSFHSEETTASFFYLQYLSAFFLTRSSRAASLDSTSGIT